MDQSRYWNIMKGLGIITVVIGHSGASFDLYLYMYHLALFFFISGFLYKDKYSIQPGVYFLSKIKSLYFPFVKYSLIFLALHDLFIKMHIYGSIPRYNDENYLRRFEEIICFRNTEMISGTLWFVVALFTTMFLFCLIRYISIKYFPEKSLIITTVLICISYFCGFWLNNKHILLSYNIELALIVLPIVLSGYLLQTFKFNIRYNLILAILCIVIIILIYNTLGSIQMDTRDFINPWAFLLSSLAGIYVNLYVGHVIEKYNKIANIIDFIGKHTYDIMALHLLSFKIISLIYVLINKIPLYMIASFPVISVKFLWIPYSIIGVIGPLLIIKYMNNVQIFIANRFFNSVK